MATSKRTGLGRGISALMPTSQDRGSRPSDVFFDSSTPAYLTRPASATTAEPGEEHDPTLAEQAATAEAAAASLADLKPAHRSRSKKAAKQVGDREASGGDATASAGASTSTPFEFDFSSGSESSRADEAVEDVTATAASGAIDAGRAEAEAASSSVDVEEDADVELVPVPGAVLRHLNPADIVPNAKQPRLEFDEDALDELILSVREFGVLQPIVVRPLPEGDERSAEGAYELIMGERRLRASKAAGLDRIPAVVRDTADDAMLRDALLENLHRSQLNPLEEASAYQQLLDDFGITQEQLAERIGRSRPQISNTLRLLKLPVDVQTRVAAGVLSAGHARAILSAREPEAMMQLADKIVNEDLSVRAAEAAAAKTSSRPERKTTIRTTTSGGLSGRLAEVGEKLGDKLNTRVKVSLGRSKGQIVIDFASMTDLNRILEELGGIDEE